MGKLRLRVLIILGVILVLFGMFEGIDIYAILFQVFQKPSFALKFAVSALCATIAFMIPKSDALSAKDYKLIKITFGFVILADFCLVLLQTFLPEKDAEIINKAGIGIFMIVQTLLIIRHSEGYKFEFKDHSKQAIHHKIFKVLTAILIYVPGACVVAYLHPQLEQKHLSVVVAIYAFMVTTSTWMGLGVLERDTFPKTNRILIAVGMSFFLFCDITVGIMTVEQGALKEIATALVYVFYTPALLLLAFSGYKKQPLTASVES